jgi:hypothetical protein
MARRGTATRRERFLPYRYERFGIDLQIGRCVLDGERSMRAINADRHLIDVSEHRFSRVTVEGHVAVPPEVVERVFPADERGEPPGELLITTRCGPSRMRQATVVSRLRKGGASYPFQLTLSRSELLGSAELTPFLVRSRAGESDGGYAALAGMRLAGSRPWELRVDRLRSPSGQHLDVRYASFKEFGPPQFPWPSNVYQLDAEGEVPVLWLNLDHAEVCEVLSSAGTVGIRARMREVFFDYITHAVWTGLILRAVRDIADHDEPTLDWAEGVLGHWLPRLYPDEPSRELQLHALRAELEDGDEGQLLHRLDGAVQQHLEVAKHMVRLAMEVKV